MTTLERRLRRLVQASDGRELVVDIAPEGVYIRERGTRTPYGPVPWGWIHDRAARLTAEKARSEREEKKETRKVTRNLLSS